jgi:4-hydroxy-tetrahydrodipicolinate reductase
MIDIVFYGLGPIGARIARRVLDRKDLRIAGAIDIDPVKANRDLGEVIGAPRTGLPVVNDLSLLGIRDRSAVAVHATSSSLPAVTPQVVALCERGLNVVSTCEQLAWPHDQPDLAHQIESAARTAGVSVIASGINPGFLMDTLPLTLSAACVRVDHVLVRRVVDTDKRRIPLQQKAGVGMKVEDFRARAAAGTLGHVGLRQSALMLADGLGWTIDAHDERLEPVIAERDTDTGLGPVPAGGCLGQRQVAVASANGREVIRYEVQMSAGASTVDEIRIEGEPPIRQFVEGGINGDIGTEAVIVNLIPVISAARPGLLTMRDLYPLTARST